MNNNTFEMDQNRHPLSKTLGSRTCNNAICKWSSNKEKMNEISNGIWNTSDFDEEDVYEFLSLMKQNEREKWRESWIFKGRLKFSR